MGAALIDARWRAEMVMAENELISQKGASMTKKIIISFLCIFVIVGMICGGFAFLYFVIPSESAKRSITLPSSVEDSVSAESGTTEESSSGNVYVADVYQSLTLREGPSADAAEKTSLPPMTHMEVLEFIQGTDYAFVQILTGENESYKGYVNYNYITRLGEPMVRVGAEE